MDMETEGFTDLKSGEGAGESIGENVTVKIIHKLCHCWGF